MKIEVTPTQAWVLKRLLENVGGDPEGPRGEMDKILWKLENRVSKGPAVIFSNFHETGEPNGVVGLDMEWL